MAIAKVLLIKDKRSGPDNTVITLEKLGYEVIGLYNGESESPRSELLKTADIALIDLSSDQGINSVQTGINISSKSDIPVIYLTSGQSKENLEKLKRSGAAGIIPLPVDEASVNAVLFPLAVRKETEKKIDESDKRYFRLAENARDMIYKMSLPDGNYEYINRAAKDVTGYAPEEFYANPKLVAEIMHPDWKHYFEVKWRSLLEGETDTSYEYQIINKSGNVRWLNQRNVLIRNEKGEPAAIEGVVTDVTESKKAESIIRRQSEEYRSIFDATPAMVVLKDTKNRIIRANKQCASYFGFKVEEFEGKYIDEMFPAQADSYYREDLEIILSGEPKLGIIEEYEHISKGTQWLKHDKYPYRNDKGEIIGIMVMTQDITLQKKTEMLLQQAEAKNTALLNAIPDIMFQYDRHGVHLNYKSKNPNDLFVSPDVFLGKKVTDILPPLIGKNFMDCINNAFQTGEMQVYEYELPIGDEMKDFEVRFIQSGENEVLGIVRNISDKKKVEKALIESELKYKNLVQNAPIALTRYIPKKRIYEFANDELIRQAGVSLEDLNSMSDEEFNAQIFEQDRPNVLNEYEKWWTEGLKGIKHMSYRIVNKPGELLWLDTFHYADFDSSQKVQAINQIYIDITERKKIEEALLKSEEQYRNLARNAPVAVTRLVVKEKKYDFVNDEFVRQCGYTMDEINEMSDNKLVDMIHKDDRKRVTENYSLWKNEGCKGINFAEYRVINKSGQQLWLNTFHYGEFGENGELETINQICIDVSDRVEANEAIKQSEEKFRAVSESMRAQIVIFQDEKFVYVNPYSSELTGYSEEELLNMSFWSLLHPDEKELARNRGLSRQKGLIVPEEYEMRIITKGGDVKWLYYSAVMISYLNKPAVLGIAFDISDRKKYEETIRNSEERYRAFIEQSSEGIYRLEMLSPISGDLPVSEQAKLIYRYSYFAECNDVFARMLGFRDTSSVIGKKLSQLAFFSEEEYLKIFSRFIEEGYRINNMEVIRNGANGNRLYFLENAVGMLYDGMLHRIWCTRKDVTEKKNAEELLRKSLSEKDILLKEIHHRVKNNLQIVSSLLKLQSHYVKDSRVSDLLRESQNRVQSMSIIHQKLYQARDLSSIDFGEYITLLSSHLVQSFGIKLNEITLNINTNGIKMSIDNAIPAGLIINELVTNSLKHAQKNSGKPLSIEITVLENEDDNSFRLIVKDSGKGIPADFDITNSPSFGLKLVSMLVEQMGGNIILDSKNGTEFVIDFKSAEYKQRG